MIVPKPPGFSPALEEADSPASPGLPQQDGTGPPSTSTRLSQKKLFMSLKNEVSAPSGPRDGDGRRTSNNAGGKKSRTSTRPSTISQQQVLGSRASTSKSRTSKSGLSIRQPSRISPRTSERQMEEAAAVAAAQDEAKKVTFAASTAGPSGRRSSLKSAKIASFSMAKTTGTAAGSRSPGDAGMSEGDRPESSKKSDSPNGSQTRRSTSPSAKTLRRGLSSVSVRASKKTGTSSPRASRQSRGVARLASAVKKTSSYRFSEKQLESKFGSGSEQSAAQLKSLNSRVMDALGEIGMPVLTPEPATAAFPRSFSTSAEKRSTTVTERISDRAVGPGESSDNEPVELGEHDVEREKSVGGVGAEFSKGQGGSSSSFGGRRDKNPASTRSTGVYGGLLNKSVDSTPGVQTLPTKSRETSQTQAKDDSRLMSSTVSLLQAVPSPGDMDAANLMLGPGGPRSASDNGKHDHRPVDGSYLRGERLPTTQVEVPRDAGKEVFLRYKKKRRPVIDAVVNFGSTARAALENALQRRVKYSAPWTTRSPASSSTAGATAAAFSWASAPVLRAIRQPALEMLQLQSLFLEQLALEPSATSPEHTREAAVLVRRLLHPATRVESALALRQSYLPLSSTTSAVLCERVVAQLAKFGTFISDQVAAAAGAAPGEDQAGNVKPGEQARARAATGIMWLRAAQESLQLLRQHFDAKTRRKTALGGELRRCLENVRAWCLEADAFSAAEQENVVGSHLPRRVSVAPSRILYRSVAAEARAVAGVARLRECAELRVGPVRAALDTLDRVVARKQQLWQAVEPFMHGVGTTLSSTVSGKGTTPAKSSAGASSTSEVKISTAPGDGTSAASAGLVKTASPPDQDEEPLAPVFPRLRSAVQAMFAVSELRAPENPGSRTLDPPGASTVRFLRDCTTIPVFLDGNDFANALLFGDPLYTEKTARDQRAGYESSLYSRGTGSDLTLRSAVASQLERAGRDQNVAEGQMSEAAPYLQGRSLAARMGSVGSSQLALTEGDEFFDDSGIHMAAILGKRRLRNQGGKEMKPEEEQHATALEEQVVLLAVTNGPEVQVSPQINAEESTSKEQEAAVTSSPLGQGVGPAAPQAVYERSHAGEDETHDDEFDVEDLALTADESLASRLILARLHDRGCRAHGIEVRLGVRRVTRRIVARGLIQQAWAMLLGLVSEVARYAQRQEVEKAAAVGPPSSGPAPEKENASSAIAGGDSTTKIVSLSAVAGAAEIRSLIVRRLNSIVRIFKTECVHMQRALFPVQHHHDELEHAVLAHFVEEAVPEREWPPDVYERYTLLSNCHSVDFFSMLDDFEAFFPEQGGQLVRIVSGVEGFLRFDKDERWFAEVGAESCGIWDAEDASGLKQRSALDAMLEEEAEMVAGKNPTNDDAASSAKQDSTASRQDTGDADTIRMTTLLKQVVEGNLPANDPGSPSRRNLDLRQKVEMMKAEVQLLRAERQRETEEREKREAEARLLRTRVANEVQKGMEEEAWLYGGKDIPVGLARPWQKGAYVRRACHPPAVSTIGWIVARLHHHQHHHDDVQERAVDVRYADGKVVRFPIPTKEEDISKMSPETALVPVKVGVFVSGLPTSTTLWRHPVNGRYDQIFFSATHTNSPAVFRNGHAVIFLHTCGKGAAAHNYWVMTSNLHACEALLEDQESVLADESSQALRNIMETSRGLIWGFHAAAEKDIFPRPDFVWTWNSLVAENVLEKKPRVVDKNQRKLPYCIEPVLIEEVAAAGAESGEAQAVRLFPFVSSRTGTSSASTAEEGNDGTIISLEAHLHRLFGRKRHGGITDDDPFSASSADGDAPDAGFFADDVNVGRQKLLRHLYEYELEGAANEEGDQDDHQSAACWYFALLAHRLARKHGTFQNRPERRDPDAVFGQMFRAGLKVAAGAQAERDAKELRRLERQRREEQWRKHVDVVEHAEDGQHLKESRTREVLFSEFQKRVKRHQERRDAAEKADATAFQRVGPHHDVTMLYSPSRARHMGLIRDFVYDNDDVLDLTTANVRLGEQPQSVLDIFDLREEMGHHMAKGIHVDTARLKRATHAAANEVAGLRKNETGADAGAAAVPRPGGADQGDHRSGSPERLSALERAAEAVGGSAADAASSWDAIMRCVTRAGRADFLAGEGGIQAHPLGFGLMKLGDGNGKETKTDATPKRRAIAVGERVLLRTLVFDPLVQLTHPEIAHLAYGCEHGSTLTVEDIDDGTGIVVVRESNPSKLGVADAGVEGPRAAAGGTINDNKKKNKAAPGAPAPAANLVALPRGLLCGVKRSRGFVLPKVHEIVTVRNVVYPRTEVPVADAHRARLRVERVFSDRIFVRDVSAGGLLHTRPGFLLPIAYVNSDVRLEHGDEALLQDGAANYVGVADEDKTGPTTLKSTAKQQDLDLLARPLTTDGRLFSSTCLFLPGTKVFLRPVVHEPPIPQWVSQKIRLHGWTCELVAADADEHGMVSIALKHGDEPCRFASVPGGCVLDNTSLFGEQELMIGEEVLLRDILWDERILGMREVVEMLNAGGRLYVVSMLGRTIADDSDAGDLEGVPGLFAHDEDFVGESDFRAGFGVSGHHHRPGQPTKNFVVCEAQLAVTSGPTDFDLSDVAAVFSTSGQNQKSQTLSTRRRRIKLPLEYLEPKVMPSMKSALPLVQHGAELYLRPVVSSRSHQLSKIWRVLALRGELRYLGRGAQTTYSDGTTFTVIKVELWNAQGNRVRRELRLPDYLLLPPHGHDRMRRDYVRAHYGDATLRKLAFAKEIQTTDAAGAGASGRPQDQGTKVEQQSLPDSATESLSSEQDEDDLVAKKLEVEVLMSANTNSVAAAMVDLPEEGSSSSRTTRSTVQQFVRELRERLAVPGRKVFAMRRDSGCWLEVRDGRMIVEKIAGPEVNRFLELFVPAQRSGTSTAIMDKFLEKLEATGEEPLSSADPHAEKPSEQDGNASKIIRAKAPSICLTVGDGMALPQLQIDGKRLFRVMLRNVVFADEKQMQPILERAKAGGELLAQVESDADAEAVEALLGKRGGGADDTPPDDRDLPGRDEDKLEGTGPEKPKSAFSNVASSVARESESSNKAGKPATDMSAEQSEQRHGPSAVAESTKGSMSERTIMGALEDVAAKQGSEEPSASAPPNKGPARESAVADTSMGTMKERAAALGNLLAPPPATGDKAAASPSAVKGKKSAPTVPQKGPARDSANPQGKKSAPAVPQKGALRGSAMIAGSSNTPQKGLGPPSASITGATPAPAVTMENDKRETQLDNTVVSATAPLLGSLKQEQVQVPDRAFSLADRASALEAIEKGPRGSIKLAVEEYEALEISSPPPARMQRESRSVRRRTRSVTVAATPASGGGVSKASIAGEQAPAAVDETGGSKNPVAGESLTPTAALPPVLEQETAPPTSTTEKPPAAPVDAPSQPVATSAPAPQSVPARSPASSDSDDGPPLTMKERAALLAAKFAADKGPGKDSGGSPPKGASPKGGKKDGAKPAAKGGGKAKPGIKGGKQAAPAPPAGKQAKPSEATSTNEARTSAAAATDIGAERADGGQRISGLSVPEGEKKHPRKTKRESVSGAKLVAQLAGLKSESDKEPRKTKRETGSGEKLVAQLAGLKSKSKHKPLSPRDKDTAVKDLAQLLAKAHKEDERHRKKIGADVEDPSAPVSPAFHLTAKLDEGTHHTEKRQSRRVSAGERRARVRSRLKTAETENYRSPDSVSPEGREFSYTVERRGTRVSHSPLGGLMRASGAGGGATSTSGREQDTAIAGNINGTEDREASRTTEPLLFFAEGRHFFPAAASETASPSTPNESGKISADEVESVASMYRGGGEGTKAKKERRVVVYGLPRTSGIASQVGGQAIAGGLRAAGLGVVPSKYFAPLWVPGLVTGVCVGFRTDVVWADWWQNRLAQLVEEAASARGPSRIVLQVVDNRFDPSLGDYNQVDPCDEACDVDLSLGIFKAREVNAGSLSSSDPTAGNAVLPSDKDKSSSVAIISSSTTLRATINAGRQSHRPYTVVRCPRAYLRPVISARTDHAKQNRRPFLAGGTPTRVVFSASIEMDPVLHPLLPQLRPTTPEMRDSEARQTSYALAQAVVIDVLDGGRGQQESTQPDVGQENYVLLATASMATIPFPAASVRLPDVEFQYGYAAVPGQGPAHALEKDIRTYPSLPDFLSAHPDALQRHGLRVCLRDLYFDSEGLIELRHHVARGAHLYVVDMITREKVTLSVVLLGDTKYHRYRKHHKRTGDVKKSAMFNPVELSSSFGDDYGGAAALTSGHGQPWMSGHVHDSELHSSSPPTTPEDEDHPDTAAGDSSREQGHDAHAKSSHDGGRPATSPQEHLQRPKRVERVEVPSCVLAPFTLLKERAVAVGDYCSIREIHPDARYAEDVRLAREAAARGQPLRVKSAARNFVTLSVGELVHVVPTSDADETLRQAQEAGGDHLRAEPQSQSSPTTAIDRLQVDDYFVASLDLAPIPRCMVEKVAGNKKKRELSATDSGAMVASRATAASSGAASIFGSAGGRRRSSDAAEKRRELRRSEAAAAAARELLQTQLVADRQQKSGSATSDVAPAAEKTGKERSSTSTSAAARSRTRKLRTEAAVEDSASKLHAHLHARGEFTDSEKNSEAGDRAVEQEGEVDLLQQVEERQLHMLQTEMRDVRDEIGARMSRLSRAAAEELGSQLAADPKALGAFEREKAALLAGSGVVARGGQAPSSAGGGATSGWEGVVDVLTSLQQKAATARRSSVGPPVRGGELGLDEYPAQKPQPKPQEQQASAGWDSDGSENQHLNVLPPKTNLADHGVTRTMSTKGHRLFAPQERSGHPQGQEGTPDLSSGRNTNQSTPSRVFNNPKEPTPQEVRHNEKTSRSRQQLLEARKAKRRLQELEASIYALKADIETN